MQMVGLSSYSASQRAVAGTSLLYKQMYSLPSDAHVISPKSAGFEALAATDAGEAIAIVLCHSPKKDFLLRLLRDPLPVESHLNHFLHDHMNAEIVTKTIENKQDAVDYMTWTLIYRRLLQNPNYYNLDGVSHRHLSDYLSELVESTISNLADSKCVAVDDNDIDLSPLNLGMIASYYYASYTTVELFGASISQKTRLKGLLELLSAATEYSEIPMGQNEDVQLQRLSKHLPLPLGPEAKYDAVSTKVFVLFQCYFSRFPLPVDLMLDLTTIILQHACKLVQALVDVISSEGYLKTVLAAMELSQMIVQGMWEKDSVLLQLPHFTTDTVARLKTFSEERELEVPIATIADLIDMEDEDREACLQMSPEQISEVALFCNNYPAVDLSFKVNGGKTSYGSGVDSNHRPIEVLFFLMCWYVFVQLFFVSFCSM
jgi:pre-mRNA-splicing helicase BRR2